MRVRFYAVGREITGVDELELEATTMHELRALLLTRFDARMARLLAIATMLHNGVRRHAEDAVMLAPGDTVDVLPPFAGG